MASSSAAAGKKNIIIKSSDGEVFEVEEAVAKQSAMIHQMIELGCTEGGIPISNITGDILTKVLEYLKKHAAVDGEDLETWDADYVNSVDKDTLYHLILAADFLGIKNLLDLCCQTVAYMIRGKSAEEIRHLFNIKNDFSPEEEEEIKRENAFF